jgi:thiamine pyrophosphate-dependent acetolactate synthase large subunit-like protein
MFTKKRAKPEVLSFKKDKKKPVVKNQATYEQSMEIKEQEKALGNTGEKAGSRSDLMAQAKAQGIKYFRILTKNELETVLKASADNNNDLIESTTNTAKERWKAGWTKNKGTAK